MSKSILFQEKGSVYYIADLPGILLLWRLRMKRKGCLLSSVRLKLMNLIASLKIWKSLMSLFWVKALLGSMLIGVPEVGWIVFCCLKGLFLNGWSQLKEYAIGIYLIIYYCPIWLVVSNHNWGPKPFRFNNCWLEHKELKTLCKMVA